MAIELATAYVTLTASARGIGDSVTRQLGGVRDAAGRAGDDGGRRLGAGLTRGGQSAASKLKGTFKDIAGMAGIAVGGAAVVGFFKDSINAAGDLNETVNKSNVIFGNNAGTIDRWARGAADKIGLSRQAALESAASFGDMFQQIGIAGGQASTMSTKVVELAADLGSFNNLPTADVVDMISGAFRGEYDSLQRVIPNISAARVEHEALATTHKKSAKELTAAEKAQAVMTIVQKDGARAAGDFAKTSDGLANSQKTLSAKFEDAKAKIGAGLLPVMTILTQVLADSIVPALGATAGWLDRNKAVLAPLAVVVGVLVTAWGTYVAITKIATAVQGAFNAVMALNPVTLVVIAIVALIAALVLAYMKVEWFRDGVNAAFTWIKDAGVRSVQGIVLAWDWLKNAAAVANDWIVARWTGMVGFFTALPGRITGAVSGMWNGLKSSAAGAYNWVVGKLGGIVSYVVGMPGRVVGALSDFFAPMYNAAVGVLRGIARAWNATLGGVSFTIPSWVPGLGGNSYSFPHMASFARGGMLQPGWNTVGENGAELVYKAGSSARVFSHTASQDIARGGGDGQQQVTVGTLVEFSGPMSVRSDQDILDLSRGIAREANRRLRSLGVSVSLSGATA